MLSRPYCNKGTVIEVTPGSVTVQLEVPGDPRGLHGLRSDMGCVVRFDVTGNFSRSRRNELHTPYPNEARVTHAGRPVPQVVQLHYRV